MFREPGLTVRQELSDSVRRLYASIREYKMFCAQLRAQYAWSPQYERWLGPIGLEPLIQRTDHVAAAVEDLLRVVQTIVGTEEK